MQRQLPTSSLTYSLLKCELDEDLIASLVEIRVGHAVADDANIHMYAVISAYTGDARHAHK